MTQPTPIIALVGHSGSGKTTLACALLSCWQQQGLRVGALKHDAHRFQLDQPGKDSHRLTQAGAARTLLCSASCLAVLEPLQQTPNPFALARQYAADLDLLLVEGFKGTAGLPKIEVHRPALGQPLLASQPQSYPGIKAVATDAPLTQTCQQLDLNNPETIAAFISSELCLPTHGGVYV